MPDLFDGRTFENVETGVEHAQSIGFDNIVERGFEAGRNMPGSYVVVGFSLGVMPAQRLAQQDPRVGGAVLCHAIVPVDHFGDGWPEPLPLDIHMSDDDPWCEEDGVVAREVAASVPGVRLYRYRGSGHLIADSSSPDHEVEQGNLVIDRIVDFVERRASTIDDQDRPEPPYAADESTTLAAFLDYQRATLAWKCRDLDGDGLAATTAASTMTLGGMLKHLAFVESYWFSYRLRGDEPEQPWSTVDWDQDPDWEWTSAASDTPDELVAMWDSSVKASRRIAEATLAGGGLETVALRPNSDGSSPSLRWIFCHMIEEYARHNGHADLIRESIDGEVGE